MPMRIPLEPYRSLEEAKDGGLSNRRISLDGQWRFQLIRTPKDAPKEWVNDYFDDSTWELITVPGSWTRQNKGDNPHYTNIVSWRIRNSSLAIITKKLPKTIYAINYK